MNKLHHSMPALVILLIRFTFTYAGNYLIPVVDNGKWGLIDENGNIIAECAYDYTEYSSEGISRVKLNGKYGYINKNGNILVTPKFAQAGNFQNGTAWVRLKDGYGYINSSGIPITSLDYEEAFDFSDGLGRVKKNGKYGYVNKLGIQVIPPKFLFAEDFKQGLARVQINIFQSNQNLFYFENSYFDQSFFSSPVPGYYVIEIKKYGFIDKSGNLNIPAQFSEAHDFSEGLAAIKYSENRYFGKWGYIDSKGNLAIEPAYYEVRDFHNGLAAVKIGSKWGYIDKQGNLVIPAQFDYADDFHEGFARVNIGGKSPYPHKCFGGKWGFIDKQGNALGKIQFDWVSRFENGLARVELGGAMGIMNTEGKYKVNQKVQYIFGTHNGLMRIQSGGYFGYINQSGKLILNLAYTAAGDFIHGTAPVLLYKNSQYLMGIINSKGTLLWQTSGNLSKPPKSGEIINSLCPEPGLNMFSLASTQAKIKLPIPYGKTLRFLKELTGSNPLMSHGLIDNWYQVSYFGDKNITEIKDIKGFVFGGYLSRLPPPEFGSGLEAYFDEKMGIIFQSDTNRIDRLNGDYQKIYGMGVTLKKKYYGGQIHSLFTIPRLSLQEAFILIKHVNNYPYLELPKSTATEQRQIDKYSFERFTVNVTRDSLNRIVKLNFYKSSKLTNQKYEVLKKQGYIEIKLIE